MNILQACEIHASLGKWMAKIATDTALRQMSHDWLSLVMTASGTFEYEGVKHRISVEGLNVDDVITEANFTKLVIMGVLAPRSKDVTLNTLNGLDLLVD